MKRTLLIAVLIFAACASAPAQGSRTCADADVSGSSTLSLLGDNLRLEKNTTFHLVLDESAGVNDRQ